MKQELTNHLIKRQDIASPRSMDPGAPVVKLRVISAAFASVTPYVVTPKQVSVLVRAYAKKRQNGYPLLGNTEKSYAIRGQYIPDFCAFLDSFPVGFYDESPINNVAHVLEMSCYSPKNMLSSKEYTERLSEAMSLAAHGFIPFEENIREVDPQVL